MVGVSEAQLEKAEEKREATTPSTPWHLRLEAAIIYIIYDQKNHAKSTSHPGPFQPFSIS